MRALLAAAALLLPCLPAAAADPVPEALPLEAEGEARFREAGDLRLPPAARSEARRKAAVALEKAADLLRAHGASGPGAAEKVEARLLRASGLAWWNRREAPPGFFGPAAGPGPGTPTGPPSRNPFDRPAGPPEAGAPAAAPASTAAEAAAEAAAFAKARRGDLPGILERWLAVLARFPDASGTDPWDAAVAGAGGAASSLRALYREVRDADPDDVRPVERPDLLRLQVLLARELTSQDSTVRERGARSLGALGSGETAAALAKALRAETVPQARRTMGEALAAIGGGRALDALGALADRPEIEADALEWLAKSAARSPVDRRLAAKRIGPFAASKSPSAARRAVEILGGYGPDGVPGLETALGTQDPALRLRVMEAMAATKVPSCARHLSGFLLGDEVPHAKENREAAMAAIRALGEEAVPHLFPALRNPRVRYWTGQLLREMTGQDFPSGREEDWVDWWRERHPDAKAGE